MPFVSTIAQGETPYARPMQKIHSPETTTCVPKIPPTGTDVPMAVGVGVWEGVFVGVGPVGVCEGVTVGPVDVCVGVGVGPTAVFVGVDV